jgi:iron-sulfur cluster assembly protein
LTDAAVAYAKARLDKLGLQHAALRVGVRGGGCAGLTYATDFTEQPAKDGDLVFQFDGLTVLVDRRSLRFVSGSVIDAKITLMSQGFTFNNPQQASTCGCGHTFSLK